MYGAVPPTVRTETYRRNTALKVDHRISALPDMRWIVDSVLGFIFSNDYSESCYRTNLLLRGKYTLPTIASQHCTTDGGMVLHDQKIVAFLNSLQVIWILKGHQINGL